MKELLAQYKSFRRLMEAYWKGELHFTEEATIEEYTPVDQRIGYKPIESALVYETD